MVGKESGIKGWEHGVRAGVGRQGLGFELRVGAEQRVGA
jgi:hypothetical protein